jgi:hypothetical protein
MSASTFARRGRFHLGVGIFRLLVVDEFARSNAHYPVVAQYKYKSMEKVEGGMNALVILRIFVMYFSEYFQRLSA